jgi:hypothetical protein
MALSSPTNHAQGDERHDVELPAATNDHLYHLGYLVRNCGYKGLDEDQYFEHPGLYHRLPSLVSRLAVASSANEAGHACPGQRYRQLAEVHCPAVHAANAACRLRQLDAGHDIQDSGAHLTFERLRDHDSVQYPCGLCTGHDVPDAGQHEPLEHLRDYNRVLVCATAAERPSATRRAAFAAGVARSASGRVAWSAAATR